MSVTVFGSLMVDLVWRPPRLPTRGETVLCSGFTSAPGGKGANQALAAARAGVTTRMIGAVGDDAMAPIALETLAAEGVDLTGVARRDGTATGAAAVLVEAQEGGENQICVGAGANLSVRAAQLPPAVMQASSVLVLQMEIPLEQNWLALSAAHAAGVKTILNNAPAGVIPAAALSQLEFLVVNEAEARDVAEAHEPSIRGWCDANQHAWTPPAQWAARGGIAAARTSLVALASLHHVTIVITLGAAGAELFAPGEAVWLRAGALQVEPHVVDTVGAGDSFVGAFAAALARDSSLVDCMKRGVAAGSLACTVHGAQGKVPVGEELAVHVAAVEVQVSTMQLALGATPHGLTRPLLQP